MKQSRELTKVAMLTAIGLVALAMSACQVESCEEKGRCPDKKPYLPVIAAARSLNLKPGERRIYRLSDPADGRTLRLDHASPESELRLGKMAGIAWVEKDEAGRLLVAIETLDHGHGGQFGLLFGDPGAVALNREETFEGPGNREWKLEEDLGGGWWRAAFR